jgi:hypothetical protein
MSLFRLERRGPASPTVAPSSAAGGSEQPTPTRRRIRRLRLLLALVLAIILFVRLYVGAPANVSCLLRGKHVPVDSTLLQGSGSLYFLPLDGFPLETLEKLAERYRQKFGLSIGIAPNVSTPAVAFDTARSQLVCERVVDFVRADFHPPPQDSHPIVLAFSTQDMYVASKSWRYAFGCWNSAGVGILSSARMASPFLGFWRTDTGWRETRLRKMTTRYIGLLYYKLPFTSDCGSVMFSSIGGPQELDLMGEDF